MKLTRRGLVATLFGLPLAARVAPKTVPVDKPEPRPELLRAYIDIPLGDHETVVVPGARGKKIIFRVRDIVLAVEAKTVATLQDGMKERNLFPPLFIEHLGGVSYSLYDGPLAGSLVVKSSSLGRITGFVTYSVV